MIPTRGDVKTRFRVLLDDPNGAVFTDAIFAEAFGEAYDALFSAFLNAQCPRIQIIAAYLLPQMTTSLTPSTAGIANFADIDELEERAAGSGDKFTVVQRCDKLPQRDMGDRLFDFVWRFDTFYFVGATTPRDLRITYESSGQAPTDDSASINVDGCLTFLSRASVAAVGHVKGYDELANLNKSIAYGPRYEQGVIGGELFRIIQPRVRSMQNVPIAPRPYSVSGRRIRRRMPYVAAQQPAGKAMAPAQFSTASGTITGTVDGVNTQFFLSYPVGTVDDLTVNGIRMTATLDYVHGANLISFQAGSIPNLNEDGTSPVITASGWL